MRLGYLRGNRKLVFDKKKILFSHDKNYLLDQTFIKLLNLILGPSVYLLVKSSIRKNTAKSAYPEPIPHLYHNPSFLISDDTWYPIRLLIPYHPPVLSDHSGLCLTKTSAKLVQTESPFHLTFLLCHFPTIDPQTAPWL